MHILGILNDGDKPLLVGKVYTLDDTSIMIRFNPEFDKYIIKGTELKTVFIPRDSYTDIAFKENDINFFLNLTDFIYTFRNGDQLSYKKLNNIIYEKENDFILLNNDANS